MQPGACLPIIHTYTISPLIKKIVFALSHRQELLKATIDPVPIASGLLTQDVQRKNPMSVAY